MRMLTRYIITDNAGQYIAYDKVFFITTDKDEAQQWKTEKAACNVLKVSIIPNNSIEGNFVVVNTKTNEVVDENKEEPQREIYTQTELETMRYKTEDAISYLLYINQHWTDLWQQLSEVEQEILDIDAYIELNQLSATKGYKAYKMMHDKMQLRREIKNMLEIGKAMRDNMMTTDRLENIQASCDYIETKRYTPRRLDNLFDNDKHYDNNEGE